MDLASITSLIGSLGFPIVMCIYLVHFMETEQKEMRDTINELKLAITTLTNKIGKDDKDDA